MAKLTRLLKITESVVEEDVIEISARSDVENLGDVSTYWRLVSSVVYHVLYAKGKEEENERLLQERARSWWKSVG